MLRTLNVNFHVQSILPLAELSWPAQPFRINIPARNLYIQNWQWSSGIIRSWMREIQGSNPATVKGIFIFCSLYVFGPQYIHNTCNTYNTYKYMQYIHIQTNTRKYMSECTYMQYNHHTSNTINTYTYKQIHAIHIIHAEQIIHTNTNEYMQYKAIHAIHTIHAIQTIHTITY